MIEHAGLVFRVPAPAGGADDWLVYLGDDDDGVALEVMAVERDDGGVHEEAQRWRV